MLLSIIVATCYKTLSLPQRVEGQFILVDPLSDMPLLKVCGESGKWRVDAFSPCCFVGKAPDFLWGGLMAQIRFGMSAQSAYIFAEEEGERYNKYARCLVQDDAVFSFGSASDNLFVSKNPYVSSHHFQLISQRRQWTLHDCGSKYGTYLNGQKLTKQSTSLSPGDVVSAFNQKFIVLPGIIAFNSQIIETDKLKGRMHTIKVPSNTEENPFSKEKPKAFFNRSPRFMNDLSEPVFSVQAPPIKKTQNEDKQATMLSYGPAVSSGLVMLLGGMNPLYGIGMAASSILWPHLSRKRNAKLMAEEEQKRQKQYEEYLQKIDAELDSLAKKQTAYLRSRSLPPKEEAKKLLKDHSHLWNRRPEHQDYLDIRMGIGDIPMRATVSFPQENELQEANDPMLQRLHEIENKPRDLKQVPIVLPLNNFQTIGFSGPKAERSKLLEKTILQLTMHVGYDDLKICLLGPISENDILFKWLPHTWDDQFSVHLIAENREEVDRILPALDVLVSLHKSQKLANDTTQGQQLLVIISDTEIAQSGVIERLLFNQSLIGVHIISLTEHGKELPSRTELAVSIRADKGRMIWQKDNERITVDFTPDESTSGVVEPMVSLMANTYLDVKTESAKMPDIVPFLSMFNAESIASLNILNRWDRADPIHTLRTPIGINEDGNLCELDLHERGDGPHGLIAGTVGSGKSELIMSFILSTAVNYSPNDVVFVMIDYKGGSMAQAFEQLPHTVGIITNLDGNEINRSLVSIQSELQYRQKLFSETERKTGIKKIDIYHYQQLFKEKKVKEALPHLVIISDEFAELKMQQPEFLQQLISTARIGRSLGVHLILATQKPSGVVDDQIWSNSNFRLCLRVLDPRDSQDMLKAPDAAGLTNVGRFYKQTGYGGSLVKAQSAWTGAEYAENRTSFTDCAVDVLNNSGTVISRGSIATQSKNQLTQLDVITDQIATLAHNEHIQARRLWLPVLEEKIYLEDLNRKYNIRQKPWALCPVVGEMDDPANQSRKLLKINLEDSKNAIVYGAIGSGKREFITTVLYSLMMNNAPDQLNIYILDFAYDGFNSLLPSPHVGDVIFSDDEEKLNRFMDMLEEAMRDRKKKLSGVMPSSSLSERLKANNTCYILVVLHHLTSIQSHLEDRFGDFVRLVAEGPRYGILFLATEESGSGLRFQLQQRFAYKYVLQMDQDDDYIALLGRTGGLKPSAFCGRGLVREEDRLFEFQIATPKHDISELCDVQKKRWKGKKAPSIRIMPENVTSDVLLQWIDNTADWHRIPVGMDMNSIEPVLYDFGRNVLNTVLGLEQDVSMMLLGLLPLIVAKSIEIIAFDIDGVFIEMEGVTSIGKKDIPETISNMFSDCKKMLTSIKDNDDVNHKPKLFVLHGIKSILDSLDDEARSNLEAMLKRARPEWNWTFLICDTPQSINSLQGSEWFKTSMSKSDMLYLGAGVNTSQYYVQVSGDLRSLSQNISFPLGYVVQKNRPTLIKFITGNDDLYQ